MADISLSNFVALAFVLGRLRYIFYFYFYFYLLMKRELYSI